MSGRPPNHPSHERHDPLEDAPDSLGRTGFLSRAARAGDRASFGELFERVMPALQAWVELRLRYRAGPRIETQDVVQEVWLRALESFDSYDCTRSFRGWVFGIAKNVLLQSHERWPVAGSLERSAGSTGFGLDVADDVTSVSLRAAKDDSLRHFMAYVDGLAPEERSLLMYCGLEEYTCAQAAQRLGISAEAATKRWQTLRERIRGNTELEGHARRIIE